LNTFQARLRRARERIGISQTAAARKVGISPKTMSGYENGVSSPDYDTLLSIASLYDVTVDYLLGRSQTDFLNVKDNVIPYDNLVQLPVLGSIRAGQPIEMVNAQDGTELVESDLIRGHDAFILRVQGNSMIGDNIHDGDRVVVIFTPDYSPADICVVAVDGHDATIKRVKCHNEVCVLVPSNPALEPMVYRADEIHIIGVVVEVRHRFKR